MIPPRFLRRMARIIIGALNAIVSGFMTLLGMISGNLLQPLNILDSLGRRRTPRKALLTQLTPNLLLLPLLLPILLLIQIQMMKMVSRSMVAYAELLT